MKRKFPRDGTEEFKLLQGLYAKVIEEEPTPEARAARLDISVSTFNRNKRKLGFGKTWVVKNATPAPVGRRASASREEPVLQRPEFLEPEIQEKAREILRRRAR